MHAYRSISDVSIPSKIIIPLLYIHIYICTCTFTLHNFRIDVGNVYMFCNFQCLGIIINAKNYIVVVYIFKRAMLID